MSITQLPTEKLLMVWEIKQGLGLQVLQVRLTSKVVTLICVQSIRNVSKKVAIGKGTTAH